MSTCKTPVAKFRVGRVVATPNALEHLSQDDVLNSLQRHQSGDWGDVDPSDFQANELALQQGTRLFSVYHATNGTKFWVITEWDRSVTTILLPEDY